GFSVGQFAIQAQANIEKNPAYAKAITFSQAKQIRANVISEQQALLPAGLTPHPAAIKSGFASAIATERSNRLNNNFTLFKAEQQKLIGAETRATRFRNIANLGAIGGIGLGIGGGFASSAGEARISKGDGSGIGLS